MDNKNKIKVYTTSSGAELSISAPFTKQVISATNNRAQYFAEQALKYREEAKVYRDSAKYYAEQNSDVTFEYIDNIKAALEEKISLKQTAGDYLLKEELPQNVSAFINDAKYVNESNLEQRLPLHNGNKDSYLYTDGESVEWKKINSGYELCDIGMALYIDETKGLRRYLNGQIVDINTNTQAFLNRLKEIQITNPDYFTDEDTWQAEALLNVDGCVYKFVLNYTNDGETVVSVRLPKYPDYVEINSIDDTAPVAVYGNGLSLGMTDGSNLVGSSVYSNWQFCYQKSSYGASVGSTHSQNNPSSSNYKTWGVTTDPTKSGLVGTANISTVQTKLKMRYFIQIATGSETENNIINDIELSNPYSLFDSKYSDHELNNISWLKSEGQWNAKSVYSTAYDKLLKIYNGTETVEGLSVKLSTEDYTDYDFVLNTADETFRLPLKTFHTDDNIDGLILYYYVGETVQNANLIDAGRIGEQLANKADKTDVDGAFVSKKFSLCNSAVTLSGASASITYDLSDYLPNDGYDYEIYVSTAINTGSTSGNLFYLFIKSDIHEATSVARVVARTSALAYSAGSNVVYVGKERYITYVSSSASSGSNQIAAANITGYRRIGKNV